jgi:hypothetical protein
MTGYDSKRSAAADKLQEPEREALKLALEALETLMLERGSIYEQAIIAIKEALAQPEQEAVGLDHDELIERANQEESASVFYRGAIWGAARLNENRKVKIGDKLYTTPPLPVQPERQPLTEDQTRAAYRAAYNSGQLTSHGKWQVWRDAVEWCEAAHNIVLVDGKYVDHVKAQPPLPVQEPQAMQGLAAYLRCEAGGEFVGSPNHETLMQWAREVDAARAQPAQESEMLTIVYQSGYYDGKQAALAKHEWNFCERCGKRTKDLTVIHTCTPPQGDA